MGITVNINSSSNEDREKLPEGIFPAVLADVTEFGPVDGQYGPTMKLRFTWITSEVDSKGNTLYAFETVNKVKSLSEKARLTKIVKALTDAPLPKDGAFDLDSLLGVQRRLVIQHNESPKDGQIYANIASYLKPDKVRVAIPRDFVRKQDKEAVAA